jgi:hypothetical protein
MSGDGDALSFASVFASGRPTPYCVSRVAKGTAPPSGKDQPAVIIRWLIDLYF